MLNFLELADYLVATAALGVGLTVGRRMRPKPPEPLRPVCSCDHGYGTHEDGKHCLAEALVQYDAFETHKTLKPCPCKQYDGPDPVMFGLTP